MNLALKQKFDYKIPLEQSDIAYFVLNTEKYKPKLLDNESYNQLYKKLIGAALKEIAETYRSQFIEFKKGTRFNDSKINYFLIGLFDPLLIDDDFIADLKVLKSAPNSRVNLSVVYEKKNAAKASEIIRKLDQELGVNTIYQDNIVTNNGYEFSTISKTDIADNIICETFRIKYQAVSEKGKDYVFKLNEARKEVWNDVKEMEKIYKKYQLWHRSPYDGAFMFRTNHGWLTTATRTPKNNVQKEDLSLIIDFDEKNNIIRYVGDRIPSSDLPEFLILVERNEEALLKKGETIPVMKYVAHFHKNEITRNPAYKKYGVPFYRYGIFKSGHDLADEILERGKANDGINISGKGRGFIILEHGLVRMGVKLEHLDEFLKLLN